MTKYVLANECRINFYNNIIEINIYFLEFLIMASSIKKSKLSETCCSRKFQAWWTDRYGMIEKDNKVICVLCCTTLVCRTSSVKRHYETNHKFLLGRSVEEQKEYISRALKNKNAQTISLMKEIEKN